MSTRGKDYDEGERLYRLALELDPEHGGHTGNFALFMAEIRKDYDEAERLYRLALQLDPEHAGHAGNFALFMQSLNYGIGDGLILGGVLIAWLGSTIHLSPVLYCCRHIVRPTFLQCHLAPDWPWT